MLSSVLFPAMRTLLLLKYVFSLISLSAICCQTVSAIPVVSREGLPMTLSDKCAEALISDVACDPNVLDFKPGYYYSPEILQRACTDTCKSALDSYLDRVKSSCGTETIVGPFDLEVSALIVPGMRKDLFQKTCLQDNGRYCNNVAATAAVIADPGVSRFNYLSSVPPGTVPPDPCDIQHVCLYVDDQSMRNIWATIDYYSYWVLYIINAGCYNMHRLNGTELCISAPGQKFVPGDATDLPGATVTTPVPAPSDAASGSNRYCGRWYGVKKGDYCNLIVLKFGITMDNFIFLNPALNSNCTNLYAEESYCVLPVGDINTYSGKPGYVSTPTGSETTATGIRFEDLPDATENPYPRPPPGPPIAEGTRDDCNYYFDGAEFQYNVTNTYWNSNCQIPPPQVYRVDPESFESWNAGLGNISRPECSFKPGFRYCGRYYALSDDSDEPTPTTPITTSDDPTSTSATPTTPTTSSKPSPGAPTMTGQPSACNKWHTVTNGESCTVIPKTFGITLEQFLAWNPTVKSDCTENFWAGYAYCVGVKTLGPS
ncbi:TPA_exp: LysM domain-containing protein [Trichophyton benhamiae CBS 112371]|uniref:LysM domain-containing protein ARB_00327 n=1 Tax=Arthroderma benhamiae (strain ATCC MYA-4681 / CBS 112371) TaxID=663331 RepID=LYSM5_ARTBC|nr:RecName: Full=LysM domain-containing protein ARB_00327; Flags: Precursor [Trichophyton benhamiae CBS 112371]DAA75949.1 TPA_exp: LysM domain-containing protein [Trichophyton benhamiae CBS 112371]